MKIMTMRHINVISMYTVASNILLSWLRVHVTWLGTFSANTVVISQLPIIYSPVGR